MIKEKQFKLILREPDHGDKELAEGSEEFVAKQRTEFSLKYNPDFLVIEEVDEDENSDLGIGGVIISLILTTLVLFIYGKKK